MTSENLRGRILPLACSAGCLAALLALASGCGTSAYSEQFDKRLAELQKVSAFAALGKTPTDSLPVNFRVPVSMLDPAHIFNLYSANPADASKYVDRDRVLPPFMLDGVGYRMTFEGKHTLNVSNSAPYFLYVWLFDAAKSKDGLIALRNLLREKLQDPKADWESVEVKTPEGKTLSWKRLHLKGQQQFDLFHNNNTEPEAASGVFELWYFDAPGWDVLLGWRATDDAWEKAKSGDAKLSDLPEIVAGTIKFKDDETRAKKPAPPNRTWVIGPVSTAPVIPGNGAATPPNATTPNPAAPPANSAPIHIGSASEWQGHPYSFTPPTGWTRQGNDPVVTFMQAGATPGTLPEVMAISMREQPETIPSNTLFRQTENDIAAKMQEFQMGPMGSVSVGDMKGESREVNGKENGLPRKMILYMVRKGAVMMIFQGIFNEENYKAMRPVFDEFVKSFRIDSGGSGLASDNGQVNGASPILADRGGAGANGFTLVPESERYHNDDLKCSIRLPSQWAVSTTAPDHIAATFSGKWDNPAMEGLQLVITTLPLDDPRWTPKQWIDQGVAQQKSNGGKILDQGDAEVDGQSFGYYTFEVAQNGKTLVYSSFVAKKGARFVTIGYNVDKSGYDEIKEVLKQSALSFKFDPDADASANVAQPPVATPTDRQRGRGPVPPAGQPNVATPPVANVPAAGPAAGPAAPPEKQGPVQIEFQDKVSASIEFPAGFQHNGKAPEASTVPPMTNEPGAVTSPPDTIKIQVAKLGAGVNYNDLRRDAINSETQGSTNNKILERGSCNIGGTSGDSIVVWIPAGNTGGNDAPRRHLVYLANNTAKRLAIKVTADIADANFKQRKEEMIKCLRTLKFD